MAYSTLISTLVVVLFCLAGHASAQDALVYGTFNQIQSEATLSGSSGTVLGQLGPMDVASVVPDPAPGYSAEKFATRVGWSTLTGDLNADGWYVEPVLFGKIDAILRLPDDSGATIRDLFLSPAVPVGVPGCRWTLAPGDVARIGVGGAPSWFITEQQVRQAFQIGGGQPANVDAMTIDVFDNIILSLEDDVTILGGALARDGAVLSIPAPAVTYNPDGTVFSVAPGGGVVLFTEAQVDLLVQNARVQNPTLGGIQQIDDLDGLCVDSLGGTFDRHVEGYGMQTFSDLLFSGVHLMGGGVLSTAAGGTIAVVNGVTLATSIPGGWRTDGEMVGLDPSTGSVGSLNALELFAEPTRFVLDSKDPAPVGSGTVTLAAGGMDPSGLLVLLLAPGPVGPCGVAPSVPLANPAFPDIYLPVAARLAGTADPLGIVSIAAPYAGGVPAGTTLVLQGLTLFSGGLALSAPLTLQF